jgi:choice-of-anchor B domain-containing protein
VWRDIKVFRDHAFVVADGAGRHGMQVFDLRRLRSVQDPPERFEADVVYREFASAHNIAINEESGIAYVVGANSGGETCGGGLHMVDINVPLEPVFGGCFQDRSTGRGGTGYTHDAMCIIYDGPDVEHTGKEVCFGANETALSIADVTDKANPVALSAASYPYVAYAHQGWITEDRRYFFLGDELDEGQAGSGGAPAMTGTRTLIWDVSDLDDPVLVKEHFGNVLTTDHNMYVRDSLLYQSNYEGGLRILNITDPVNPVEVGFLDTVPDRDTDRMNGSWSNYPYFASGTIAVTSRREGVFFVRYRPQELLP